MDIGIPREYVQIAEETLTEVALRLDTLRSAFNDCYVYRQRHNNRTFAYKHNDGTCWLRPDLVQEEETQP